MLVPSFVRTQHPKQVPNFGSYQATVITGTASRFYTPRWMPRSSSTGQVAFWIAVQDYSVAHIRIQVDAPLKPNRVAGQEPSHRGVKVTARQQQQTCLCIGVVTPLPPHGLSATGRTLQQTCPHLWLFAAARLAKYRVPNGTVPSCIARRDADTDDESRVGAPSQSPSLAEWILLRKVSTRALYSSTTP